jgi:hypothetical protein
VVFDYILENFKCLVISTMVPAWRARIFPTMLARFVPSLLLSCSALSTLSSDKIERNISNLILRSVQVHLVRSIKCTVWEEIMTVSISIIARGDAGTLTFIGIKSQHLNAAWKLFYSVPC